MGINLPNVRIQSSSGAFMSDIQQCANNVATNRAQDQGCSALFHTGGAAGICQCLRLGYVCDRDESETGVSIYELTPGSLQNPEDESPADNTNEFKWTYIVVFGAAFLATTGASLFYYKNMNNRDNM